jgi:hypothetical protein
MDRRKIYLDNQQTFYNSLNNKDLNLEIAKNIELLVDLKDVIRVKAMQSYEEQKEGNKVFTISTHRSSLEDRPKLVYVLYIAVWWLCYRRQMVNKISFLWGLMGLSIFLNLSKKLNNYRKTAL